jgi:bacterioferritin-associated ferredoxin
VSAKKEIPDKDKPAADNPAGEIICACSGTTRGQVYDLVQQGKDLDAISRWTGAKTGCGGCDWDLEVFVNALLAQKQI